MPRIETISYQNATDRLKEIYDDLIAKRGKLANVHTIQSLHPESIVAHMGLYMEIMFSRSELSRANREMMAVVVSVHNQCSYCVHHHIEALRHYWKDDERCDLLIADPAKAGLSNIELLLCSYAEELTLRPETFHKDDFIRQLQSAGLSDSALLDATLVVSYFNFVNRIVLALDVEDNPDERSDYKY
jgi:uncharacterized peroxidase-related enzyme